MTQGRGGGTADPSAICPVFSPPLGRSQGYRAVGDHPSAIPTALSPPSGVSLFDRSLAVCWSVQVMLNGLRAVRLLYKQRARSMDDFSMVSSVVATVCYIKMIS